MTIEFVLSNTLFNQKVFVTLSNMNKTMHVTRIGSLGFP